jgi:uncharacterized protein YfaQ (DUF2300 family)
MTGSEKVGSERMSSSCQRTLFAPDRSHKGHARVTSIYYSIGQAMSVSRIRVDWRFR